jgi:L-alanine-DL-glutamate epimerase-like enolase superfamily enzyme
VNRLLTTRAINIQQGFENCREAIGWDHDIMVHCHWEYDLRTSIQIADAIESIKPVWLEIRCQWTTRLVEAAVRGSKVPICMGENLSRRESSRTSS